jgi:hypothetical protein
MQKYHGTELKQQNIGTESVHAFDKGGIFI